jgi:hypothetical protein
VARKKQQGKGSGTVYLRKNKDGKITLPRLVLCSRR